MLKLSIGVVPAMCVALADGSANVPGEAEHLKPIAVMPPPFPPEPAEPPAPPVVLPALPPFVAPALELPPTPAPLVPPFVAVPPVPAFVALPPEPPLGILVEPVGVLFALHAAHTTNANTQDRRCFI
jgi:hypothetical protein